MSLVHLPETKLSKHVVMRCCMLKKGTLFSQVLFSLLAKVQVCRRLLHLASVCNIGL